VSRFFTVLGQVLWVLLRGIIHIKRVLVGSVYLLLLGTVVTVVYTFSQPQALATVVSVLPKLGVPLRAEKVEGTLWGLCKGEALTLKNARYGEDKLVIALDHATVRLRVVDLWQNQIHLTDLQVGKLSLRLPPPSGKAAEPLPLAFPFRLIIDQLHVQAFDLRHPDDRPLLQTQRVTGQLDWPQIQATVQKSHVENVGTFDLSTDLTLMSDHLRLHRIDVTAPFGLQAVARVYTYPDLFITAEGDWQNLAVPFDGEHKAVTKSGRGHLRFAGVPEKYDFSVKGDFSSYGYASRVDVTGTGSDKHAEFDQLKLKLGQGSIEGAGKVIWLPQVKAEADVRIKNLNPATLLAGSNGSMNGLINGRIQAKTDILPRLAVNFAVDLAQSQWRGYPLALQAKGQYVDQQLRLSEGVLITGSNRLNVAGALYPKIEAKVQLNAPQLSAFMAGLGGGVQLQANVKGDARGKGRIDLQTEAQVQGLAYQGFSLQKADLKADVHTAFPDFRLQQAQSLSVQGEGLSVAGNTLSTFKLGFAGSQSQHDLAVSAVLDQPLKASADLRFQGGLLPFKSWQSATWRGQVLSAVLGSEYTPTFSLEAPTGLTASAKGGQWQEGCWLALPRRLCSQGQWGQALATQLRFERLPFADVRRFLPPKLQLDGELKGTAAVQVVGSELRSLQADLETTPLSIDVPSLRHIDTEAIRLQIAPDGSDWHVVLTAPLRQPVGNVAGDIRLAMNPNLARLKDSPLVGSLLLNLPDIAPFVPANPEITELKGRIEGKVELSGTPSALGVLGKVELLDGKAKLFTPNLTLENLSASMSGAATGPLTFSASATSGGTLTLKGSIDPLQPMESLEMRLRGKEIQVFNTLDARIIASPDIRLNTYEGMLYVNGVINVPKGEITPRQFSGGQGVSSDQVFVGKEAPPPSGVKLSAVLDIRLGDNVVFNGFDLKTKLTGGVIIDEGEGHPTRARGEVRLLDGRYKAYGQDLQITLGRLFFDGGSITRPALDIRAERELTSEQRQAALNSAANNTNLRQVGVMIRGKLDRPEFQLFSDPSNLTREEQIAWLVLGRPLATGDNGSQDRAVVGQAATALGLGGAGYLAGQIGSRLGLDEVTVASQNGSQDQARLTLGKYLSPRLFVSYGVNLFQPGYSFRMLYDLGRGFKLAAEQGAQSSGGDVLYTIEK
jgi:translocation and assembly module TamB